MEEKLEISKYLTKWGVKKKIINFLDEYEEKHCPFVKVELKNGETIYGMISGGPMRYHLILYTLWGNIRSVEFKKIRVIKILNNYKVLKLFASLYLYSALRKRAEDINKKFNDTSEEVEGIFGIKF